MKLEMGIYCVNGYCHCFEYNILFWIDFGYIWITLGYEIGFDIIMCLDRFMLNGYS